MVQEASCDMVKEYSCGSIFRRVSAAPSVGISRSSYTDAADRFHGRAKDKYWGPWDRQQDSGRRGNLKA